MEPHDLKPGFANMPGREYKLDLNQPTAKQSAYLLAIRRGAIAASGLPDKRFAGNRL